MRENHRGASPQMYASSKSGQCVLIAAMMTLCDAASRILCSAIQCSLDPWSDRADPGTPGPTCRPSRDAARPSPEASHPRSSVRGQATAVEGSCDFLGVNGWKREWQNRIIGHGGEWRLGLTRLG